LALIAKHLKKNRRDTVRTSSQI